MEKHSKYIICSGFVAIAHGRSRGTEDIDMILEKLSKERFVDLHKDLVRGGFICIQSDEPNKIYEYLDEGMSVRYVLNQEGFFLLR